MLSYANVVKLGIGGGHINKARLSESTGDKEVRAPYVPRGLVECASVTQ